VSPLTIQNLEKWESSVDIKRIPAESVNRASWQEKPLETTKPVLDIFDSNSKYFEVLKL